MTRVQRFAVCGAALLITGGLVVAAVVWGRNGLELLSWLAGIGSLFVAVATAFLTAPAPRINIKKSTIGQVFTESVQSVTIYDRRDVDQS
jgi:hypothetical protein